MKLLTRLLMVLVLLGGLAYGSYALGRYVLTYKLFGASVKPVGGSGLEVVERSTRVAASVTRQTDIKGKTHVEVDVLPADEAGPGPEPPSISDLQKVTDGKEHKPATADHQRIVTPDSFKPIRRNYDDSGSLNDANDGQPHRRRRQHHKTNDTATNTAPASDIARSDNSDNAEPGLPATSAAATDDGAGAQQGATNADSSDSGDNSTVSERPAERSRHHHSNSDAGAESQNTPEPRHERSRPRHERSESPVPAPEGGDSGGGSSSSPAAGDSPVPQPE